MYRLNDLGLLCTLGADKAAVAATLLDAAAPLPDPAALFTRRGHYTVGEVAAPLNPLPAGFAAHDCRNNRLAAAALEQIRPAVESAIAQYGARRVGAVLATSTSGIAETGEAVRSIANGGGYPPGYHAGQGVLAGLAEFSAALLGLQGPAYTMSTACSSSANAALSARRLLASGVCDAVVFGGVDTLCEMTLQGFGALAAQSAGCCKPFTRERDGINIGEAAAVFLMSREGGGPRLLGGAGSSDAHHISAPHPEGEGACRAMRGALADAGLQPGDIDYLNLHGTGTPQNDSMESIAAHRVFGDAVPCSSTKSMTGHTLGAAGALELGFCYLLLQRKSDWRLPPALYRDERDPALAPFRWVGDGVGDGVGDEAGDEAGGWAQAAARPRYCQSNSFAFGGSNVSLILGAEDA